MADVLGRYHIISELGRGGMGVVYKALDPKLERFIAIKCLGDELSNDEIVVARFLREARNVAALNHPNIAQIFVADEHEGRPYFVMEYVDGESLADFIEREGQCSPEMARRVTEQSAQALAAAASENIVHRDVKPGNIMLDRRGRAVLTDFGIACVAARPGAEGQSTTLMGTPGYLPPEALTGQQPDCRGDIFALGLVWFEMLTGRRLVVDTDLKATLAQYMAPGFPDLSELDGRADARVIRIIARMLAVSPEARYPDCASLLEDMAPLKTGQTGPVARADSGPEVAATVVTATPAPGHDAGTRDIEPTAVTENIDTASARAPDTVPVTPERGSGRGRRFAILGVLVASAAMIALGVARMDEAQWDRVTGLFADRDAGVAEPVSDEPIPATDHVSDATDEPGLAYETAESETELSPAALAGQAQVLDDVTEPEAQLEPADAEASAPEVTEPEVERAMAMQSPQDELPAADAAAADPGQTDSTTGGDAPEPAAREMAALAPQAAEPEPEPPAGVAVIGVGDGVIADPMVREIEQALRSARSPLVDKRFIGDYSHYVDGDELDLAGLAGPAAEAGVRYVVVARALPAGSRELRFYNRYETAWIVQLEARTFDLHLGREIGASPLEQIEYTSLNATERARESVRPWLPGLRAQFD
jgi:eukaryotic-like serine/threonine-protein kinase